ncbi:hypothetical protein M378DRAFT_165741 [Amanita muscaria Koide BX008]|uniref:Uncharacterized protein n=1 Tax=Amanita muscaria (strain Koide BX008) TaxID=946122 RepID=A0A0C2SGY9_AMAMK|nr:hypothetical protein M378DRAFT_165741 [Amanita muscaria Koide BX008]
MRGFRIVGANGKSFFECVEDGTIDLPKVSKDEILARSKGDSIAKTITVIQTAWFVIQCIHRRSQHLLLTELEITTLAHTLISFFMYFFWWHKPYGVALPIEVPFKERRPESIGERDGKVESKGDGNDNIQVPQTNETGENPAQPLNDDPSRTSEKCVPVATKSSDDKSPASAAAADKEFKSDVEASNGTPTSPQLSWYTRLGLKTLSVSKPEQLSILGRIVLNTVYLIVGGGFGAMHCLAWNSAFPTRAEQLIWQVSSLIVAVFGGTAFLIGVNDLWDTEANVLVGFIFIVIVPMYCFARISLLILALLQLRALPYAGYATPSWSMFYPHIG